MPQNKNEPMQIELHPQPEAIKCWEQLCADPELARLPYKIETDRFSRILMSPPPAFDHTRFVGKIIRLLNQLLPEGLAVAETPVHTADGIKVTDAAWLAPGREQLEKGELVLERAPEICIEVLSPSNSSAEMTEKRALYF